MVKRLRYFFLTSVIIALPINSCSVRPQTPFFPAASSGEIIWFLWQWSLITNYLYEKLITYKDKN